MEWVGWLFTVGILGMMLAAAKCCCTAHCICSSTCTSNWDEIQITIDGFSGVLSGLNGTWVVQSGTQDANANPVNPSLCVFQNCGSVSYTGGFGGTVCKRDFVATVDGSSLGFRIIANFKNTCHGYPVPNGSNCNTFTDVCSGKTPAEVTAYVEVAILADFPTGSSYPFSQLSELWRSDMLDQIPIACGSVADFEATYYDSAYLDDTSLGYRYSPAGLLQNIGAYHITADSHISTSPGDAPSSVTVSVAWA